MQALWLLVLVVTQNSNQTPKYLDEKIKYDVHTEQVEGKALRSLDLLRRVKETEVFNSKCT